MWLTGVWLGALLAAVTILSTTANAAVRHFSRVTLAERLQKRGREELLNLLTKYRAELLSSTSFLRMGSILGLVFLISHWFGVRPMASPVLEYTAVFVTAMIFIMIFGVAIPNAWARYSGEAFLAVMLPVLLATRYALYPIIAFMHLFDGLVRRLAGVPDELAEGPGAEQIEKEILDVVSEGEKSGVVHEDDADMIESIMELRDRTAGEIMTPRIEIVALPETATLFEAKDLITRTGHSRIPVYGENIDDIKGVLYAKDLLNIDDSEPFDPTEVMRKVPFVPETKSVMDLLQELRAKKVHLAVVLDEYGGTAGLVTFEDIFEEIVGDIADEYETPEPSPIRRIDEHTLEVDARVRIDELNDELGIELPDDENYDTVGGFVFS